MLAFARRDRRPVRRAADRRPRPARRAACRSPFLALVGHFVAIMASQAGAVLSRLSPADASGVVVLTQGTRPDDLRARAPSDPRPEGRRASTSSCVGNGWEPAGLPDGRRAARPAREPRHPGRPQPRRRRRSRGDYIFFLDDDASIPSPTFLADAIALLARRPAHRPGAAAGRRPERGHDAPALDPAHPQGRGRRTRATSSRSGRARCCCRAPSSTPPAAGPSRSSTPTRASSWPGGSGTRACAPGTRATSSRNHPAIEPTRHSYYYRLNARNRVWLAKRNLPAVLVPLYVGIAGPAIQVLRWARQPAALQRLVRRLARGLARRTPGERRPLSLAHGVADDAGRAPARSSKRSAAGDARSAGGIRRRAPSATRVRWNRGYSKDVALGIKLVKGVCASARRSGSCAEARRAAAARAGTVQDRGLLRRRPGQPLPDAAVVRAAGRARRRPGRSRSSAAAPGAALALLDEAPVPVAYVRKVADLERLRRRAGPARSSSTSTRTPTTSR